MKIEFKQNDLLILIIWSWDKKRWETQAFFFYFHVRIYHSITLILTLNDYDQKAICPVLDLYSLKVSVEYSVLEYLKWKNNILILKSQVDVFLICKIMRKL